MQAAIAGRTPQQMLERWACSRFESFRRSKRRRSRNPVYLSRTCEPRIGRFSRFWQPFRISKLFFINAIQQSDSRRLHHDCT
jgi:hypothetical protein